MVWLCKVRFETCGLLCLAGLRQTLRSQIYALSSQVRSQVSAQSFQTSSQMSALADLSSQLSDSDASRHRVVEKIEKQIVCVIIIGNMLYMCRKRSNFMKQISISSLKIEWD